MIEPNLKTLLTKLNYTGLAQKQPDLYQFLHDLFLGVQQINKNVADINATVVSGGGGGGSTVTNIINQQFLDFGDGSGGGDGGDIVPGSAGPTGAAGSVGPAGITTTIVFSEDSISESDSLIPGPTGQTGTAGATGAAGITTTIVFSEDGVSESDSLIPGPSGSQGLQGIQGLPGTQGIPLIDTEFPEDPLHITGPQGIQGLTGPQGLQGVPLIDHEYPEDPLIIPGLAGVAGANGATGPQGPISNFIDPELPDDPLVLVGPQGPIATMVDFIQDLGVNERSGTFDITGLSGLTVGNDVTIVQTSQAVASKGNARDEFEMDGIQLTGYVLNTTTIRAYWWSPSVVVGVYAFAFAVAPSAISIGNVSGWVRIDRVITTGSQAIVDFTGISSIFTSLKILWFSQDTTAGTSASTLRLRFNNDSTAANYSSTSRIGSQASSAFASPNAATSNGVQFGSHPNIGNTGIVGTGEITFIGYSSSTFQKRMLAIIGEDFTGSDIVGLFNARWNGTTPINRITILTDGTAFVDGSTYSLYGIP